MARTSGSADTPSTDANNGRLPVACAQMTWTNMPNGDPDVGTILDEIARAGYDGTPLPGERQRPFRESMALYAHHGLRPAPGYLGGPMWQPEERERLVAEARSYALALRDAGCSELYIAAGGHYVGASGRSRRDASGHVRPEDGLRDAEIGELATTVNEIGRATLAEGVRSCFHNHVGTVIETRQEFERLLARTDPEVLFLGPDTGHLAWAGDDPVTFCRDHADRIKTIHLKEINTAIARAARDGEWDYGRAKDAGIFAELGEGETDFPAIMDALTNGGFASWLVVETDVTQKSTAFESAVISRRYLQSIGV